MPCIDCESPVTARFDRGRIVADDRCDDCLEEVLETPAWRDGPPVRSADVAGREAPAQILSRSCAEPECERPARKRGLCCTHYNRLYQPNRSHGPSAKEWAAMNPVAARLREFTKKHRRRAARHAASAEVVDRRVVGDRDGWRCGICAKKINPALRWPSPLSQSLDHIEPISKGGAHTYANCRIAHLRCNTARGATTGGEQLALIG